MKLCQILLCFLVVFATAKCLSYFSVIKKLWKPHVSKILQIKSDKSQCATEIKAFIDDLLGRKTWALEMLDASAKPQTGILNGNIAQMGNFDQCLGVEGEYKNHTIRGKYCTAVLKLEDRDAEKTIFMSWVKQKNYKINANILKNLLKTVEITWDLCVPTSCSGRKLQEIWNRTNVTENYGLKLIFDESRCFHAKKKLEKKSLDSFATAFFTTIGMLLLFSTLYDVFTSSDKEDGVKRQLLTSFSVYTNSVKLFTSKRDPKALSCIDGIRVLSLILVIFTHRCLFDTASPSMNRSELVDLKNGSSQYMLFSGGQMAVDTFFTVSGLLVVYVYLCASETFKISYFAYCLHRIVRLTPAFLAVILLLSNVTKHLANGPYWNIFAKYHYEDNCENYKWLRSLLFVQNWYAEQCSGHAWYLSADTQMYFLAPLFLPHFRRHPKKTVSALLGTMMAISFAFFWISWRFELTASPAHFVHAYYYFYYTSTYARIKPWLLGCVFGYLIYKTRKEGVLIYRHLVVLLWSLSLVTMFSITYITFYLHVSDYNKLYSSLFNGFARPIWGLCICWIIFACTNGYGGPINTFLSSTIFSTLARLNYSMYLVHLPVMLYFLMQRRHPEYFGFANVLHESAGDFLFTTLAAVFWTMAFESPIVKLEKLLLRRETKRIEDDKEMVGKRE